MNIYSLEILQAIMNVHRHVYPKKCFITTDNGKEWRPINGTGCAHFVAHQLGIKRGFKGGTACIEGYAISVRLILQEMCLVQSLFHVGINDVWFNDATFKPQTGKDHCGIVTSVRLSDEKANTERQVGLEDKPMFNLLPIIEIKHCSSHQGGIFTNEWSEYFHGEGKFYRLC